MIFSFVARVPVAIIEYLRWRRLVEDIDSDFPVLPPQSLCKGPRAFCRKLMNLNLFYGLSNDESPIVQRYLALAIQPVLGKCQATSFG